jgi:hypothetical protein
MRITMTLMAFLLAAGCGLFTSPTPQPDATKIRAKGILETGIVTVSGEKDAIDPGSYVRIMDEKGEQLAYVQSAMPSATYRGSFMVMLRIPPTTSSLKITAVNEMLGKKESKPVVVRIEWKPKEAEIESPPETPTR